MTDDVNELENIFVRLANSLETSVLPHVRDHYATMQLRAAREMLQNLGARVEWRQESVAASRSALHEALESLSKYATKAPREGSDERTLRAQLTMVIEQVYDPAMDPSMRERTLAEIWRVIRFEFDAEAARIKTGMFS